MTASQVIDRLRPQLAKIEGAALFLQPGQDITVGGRVSRAQFQYTLQDASLDELTTWVPRLLDKLKTLPRTGRRFERPLSQCAAALDHHQPRSGGALRHPAAVDRRHAQRRLRPAPDRAVFHAAQYLQCHPRNPAGLAGRPRLAEPDLREIADYRPGRAAVDAGRLSTPARSGRCRCRIRASSRP